MLAEERGWRSVDLERTHVDPADVGGLRLPVHRAGKALVDERAATHRAGPKLAELLPDVGDHERTTFPQLARGKRLAGYQLALGVYWRAIDTAKDLTEAAKELAACRDSAQ